MPKAVAYTLRFGRAGKRSVTKAEAERLARNSGMTLRDFILQALAREKDRLSGHHQTDDGPLNDDDFARISAIAPQEPPAGFRKVGRSLW